MSQNPTIADLRTKGIEKDVKQVSVTETSKYASTTEENITTDPNVTTNNTQKVPTEKIFGNQSDSQHYPNINWRVSLTFE